MNDKKLTNWTAAQVTQPILLRLRIVQATLRFLENPRVDAVEEIREEHLSRQQLSTARGKALDRTAESRGDISREAIVEYLRQNAAGVPGDDELVDHLNAFIDEKGLVPSDVLDALLKTSRRNHSRVSNFGPGDMFSALGLEGMEQPSGLIESQPEPSSARRRAKGPATGKLRTIVSDEAIANGVAQYLTNFGRGAIRSDFVFTADGTPVVHLYADEPFSELILQAHARHTLPRMIRCRNPKCTTAFRPSRPDQVYCEKLACREYVKKMRQRSIARARDEWENLKGDWRRSADRAAWIAARASAIASEKAGGTIHINEHDVARNRKRRRSA